MSYNEGEVWVLEDGKEYLIIKKLDIGINHYVMMITEEEPIEMKLGSMIEENGNLKFKTTKNKEQAMYILEAMIHQS